MKRSFKLLSILLMVVMLIPISLPVKAQEDELTIQFSKFQFTTQDYDPNEVHVEYETIGNQQRAYIINNSEEELERFTLSLLPASTSEVFMFTRKKNYGDTVLACNITVELYNSGSFRAINRIINTNTTIDTYITNTYLENVAANSYSANNEFPTTEITYASNGTIVATISGSTSEETNVSIISDLLSGGFSYSNTSNDITYYRTPFFMSGTISLY